MLPKVALVILSLLRQMHNMLQADVQAADSIALKVIILSLHPVSGSLLTG